MPEKKPSDTIDLGLPDAVAYVLNALNEGMRLAGATPVSA